MNPKDLIATHLSSEDRPVGQSFGVLDAASLVVPRGAAHSEERLGSLLLLRRPDPLADNPETVWAWFKLLELLAEEPGLTARQLARRLNLSDATGKLSRVLEVLAAQGDLIPQAGGATRYRAKAWSRVLPHYLKVTREIHPSLAEGFDYATLAY